MLTLLYASFAGFIERQAAGRWYPAKLVGFILLLTAAFQPPHWPVLLEYDRLYPQDDSLLGHFRSQVDHPFTAPTSAPESHQAKTTFRLVPPLLARVLHTGVLGIYLLQVLIGGAMFWVLYRLLLAELADPVAATVFTSGTALTYFGYAYLFDIYFFFDGIAYACLVGLLYVRRPYGLALLTVVAGFTDERALLAALLPVFWHATAAYRRRQRAAPLAVPLTVQVNPQVWAIGLGWVGYGLLRAGLAVYFHLPTHTAAIGLDVLVQNMEWQAVQVGFVGALESYWGFVGLLLVVLISQRRYAVALLFLGCLLPSVLGSFLVYDITRSLAYVFPAAIIGVVLLRPHLSRPAFHQLILTISLAAALITSGYVINGQFWIAGSLFALLASGFGPPQ